MSALRNLLIASLTATVLTVASPATATTVLQVSVPEMTHTSQWVVRAYVVGSKVVDLRAYDQGIFTDYDLLITDVYKGTNVPERYTLRVLGGRGDDGTTLKIPGMPGFIPGQDVVVFLEATSLGHIPCGLGQGVWRVFDSPSGSWARQAAAGVHMLRRGTSGQLVPADPTLVNDVRPLDDLIEAVIGSAASTPTITPRVGPLTPPTPLSVKP